MAKHSPPWSLVAAAMLVVGLVSADFAPAATNVVFIIADDLSAEALACYGNSQCRTPAIDRLAEQGLRFERAWRGVR